MRFRRSRQPLLLAAICAVSSSLVLAPIVEGQATVAAASSGTESKRPDVFFVPTPQEVVDRMLALAKLKKGDVLYDLGCGDGRIVVTAAKRYGIRAVGFDVDPRRVHESRQRVEKEGVGALVTIKEQDIFATDLSRASVVTLYLLPNLNVRLMPQLRKLKPGSRIISHAFAMKGARPNRIEKVRTRDGGEKVVYFWVVPWDDE